jgi:hypothetical protein
MGHLSGRFAFCGAAGSLGRGSSNALAADMPPRGGPSAAWRIGPDWRIIAL